MLKVRLFNEAIKRFSPRALNPQIIKPDVCGSTELMDLINVSNGLVHNYLFFYINTCSFLALSL